MTFALNAYAARSCPVVTQNQFHPLLEPVGADEELREVFHGGIEFQDRILDQVAATFTGTLLDLRPLGDDYATRVARTGQAFADGVEVVIGGMLPVDRVGHRSGAADLWVRGADSNHGTPGYLPVECKFKRMLERRTGAADEPVQRVSSLNAVLPASAVDLDGHYVRYSRERDLIQLAHYWRQLDALGVASSGSALAGVIGNDVLDDALPVIAWVDLELPKIRTFSRSADEGWTLRTVLERYDHEHGFRVEVAERAMQQTGAPDDPPLLVQPIRIRECDRCVWWSVCREKLHDDDLSLRFSKSPLDVREIQVLRSLGFHTATDLAGADLDDLLPRYLPEVTHRPFAEDRLRLAARRAALILAGVQLDRLDPAVPIETPEASIEIDFDIETSAEGRIYLWGFLVDDHAGPPRYIEFSSFEHLDDAAEAGLAVAAMRWLRSQLEGTDALVYHYSDYERIRLADLAQRSGEPALAWAVEVAPDRFVDLFTLVRQHFFGTDGLGLKVVAHAGAGFSWRDDDPGGLNSQRWFSDAVSAPNAADRERARVRVLEYNEDDVRATHAVRWWLRGADSPPRVTGE